MDERITEVLTEEILREFEALNSLETGSKEKQAAVQDIVVLCKLHEDDIRINCDYEKQLRDCDHQDREDEIRKGEAEDQKKTQIAQLALSAGHLVLTGVSLIAFNGFYKRGFRFEETGSYTSQTFRHGLSNFFRMIMK